MKLAITVDAGKHSTKAKGSWISNVDELVQHKVFFDTKYYDLSEGDVDVQGNSFKIVYEDKEVVLGEQGELFDTSITKTSFLHKIAIFTAITQFIELSGDKEPSIVLTIGCPTTIFRNAIKKEEYRSYIGKDTQISVNGKTYVFKIERIIIKNEASGIVYLEPLIFTNQRVAVIDLGGKNFNFAIFDNGVLVPSSSFSNNYGGTKLQSMVRQELNIALSIDCDLTTAKKAIENGGIFLDGTLNSDSSLIVKQTIQRYIDDLIIKSLEENNITVNLMPVIAIGGTSSIVLDALKKAIPHISIPTNSQGIDDFIWANASGFHIVCLAKAGMING